QSLGELLKHPDMRIRQKAQFALVKRKQKGARVFEAQLGAEAPQLARIHSIWGISQLARQNSKYAGLLVPLLKDRDPEIRAQAAKWLGDIKYHQAGNALIAQLTDTNARARFFAAEALGRIQYKEAVPNIIKL